MPTIRIIKNKNYTVMSNYHLQDRNLSNKGRGLLSTMLSLPADWDYTVRGLAKICKDGTDSIAAQLRELEDTGYLIRKRTRKPNGQLGGFEYFIFEVPQENQTVTLDAEAISEVAKASISSAVIKTALPQPASRPNSSTGHQNSDAPHPGNPDMENPDMENPDMENPDMENPDVGNPDMENPDVVNPDVESPDLDFPAQENTRYNKILNEQSTHLQIDSIPSFPRAKLSTAKEPGRNRNEGKRVQAEQEELREQVRDNVGLEDFETMFPDPDKRKIASDLVSILEDTVCSTKPFVRVCGEDKPASVVRAELLKVEFEHIELIVDNLGRNKTNIRNPYQYMLAALYRAPSTFEAQLQAMVQHNSMADWSAADGGGSYY